MKKPCCFEDSKKKNQEKYIQFVHTQYDIEKGNFMCILFSETIFLNSWIVFAL